MGPELSWMLLLLAASVVIFWTILKYSAGKIAKQYQVLEERFGLELEHPPAKMGGFVRPEPSLYGSYRGREVSFSAPGKGIKGSRQIETVLKVELKDGRLRAQVAATGVLGRLRQRDSGSKSRWKSGDEAFDQAVDVRTPDAKTFEVGLDDERRRWLMDHLKRSKASIYIADGTIAYARLGLIAGEATRLEFEAVVEFLCDFAEAVEA